MQNTPISEYNISGLEAMLAGTLALMSAYAHDSCAKNQDLMAHKIISNLTCLQHQASLSPEFRQVLAKVMNSWQQHRVLRCDDFAPPTQLKPPQLWHVAPEAIQ